MTLCRYGCRPKPRENSGAIILGFPNAVPQAEYLGPKDHAFTEGC